MFNVGFIPARAGSKGIKSKNIKEIKGKPLIFYSLKAAQDSCLKKIYVSTDSNLIKEVINNFEFNKVEVISRSEESANDSATSESALIEFAKNYEFDNVCFLQATSPFTTKDDINGAINIFKNNKYGSVISVIKNHQFLWTPNGQPTNYNPQARPRRQDWEGYYIENGAFYISSRKNILKNNCRITMPVGFWEMKKNSFIEIDEEEDIKLAKKLL